MFTVIALVAVALVAWFSQRQERAERKSTVPLPVETDYVRQRILYIREDVRLICYLLMAVLVMLGIIADRLH